jgi:LPS O-antigen subunit length determinant protein (WzzB/FepE family)
MPTFPDAPSRRELVLAVAAMVGVVAATQLVLSL